MKLHRVLALSLALVTVSSVHAAEYVTEILSETEDHTAGKASGGVTGLMFGAIGGPIGAVLGAGVGMLVGHFTQDGTNTHDRAYVIRTPEGKEKTVRSPKYEFAVGEKVQYRRKRLYPISQEVAKVDAIQTQKAMP
ncbi:hypothetical protein ACFOJE_10925 [Azotobacter bryophylli]|uniref:Glycine zipper domain-containing protein n=1 Tax=Azotobacter bryophylli TaxID=1986537 RepID=A0ABV7AUI0_9GAMM